MKEKILKFIEEFGYFSLINRYAYEKDIFFLLNNIQDNMIRMTESSEIEELEYLIEESVCFIGIIFKLNPSLENIFYENYKKPFIKKLNNLNNMEAIIER